MHAVYSEENSLNKALGVSDYDVSDGNSCGSAQRDIPYLDLLSYETRGLFRYSFDERLFEGQVLGVGDDDGKDKERPEKGR